MQESHWDVQVKGITQTALFIREQMVSVQEVGSVGSFVIPKESLTSPVFGELVVSDLMYNTSPGSLGVVIPKSTERGDLKLSVTKLKTNII